MAKKKPDIIIIPFERGYGAIHLDLDTVSNAVVFRDAFWNHFTSTFPVATITIFCKRDDRYDNVIKLSDSSYTYGIISSRNQLSLKSHLP